MNTCSCSGTRNSICFDSAVVLWRCGSCGSQQWSADGRPVGRAVALGLLRQAFTDHRYDRPARQVRTIPSPRPVQVVDVRTPAPVPSTPADLQASLDAFLAEKGLSGSWRVGVSA